MDFQFQEKNRTTNYRQSGDQYSKRERNDRFEFVRPERDRSELDVDKRRMQSDNNSDLGEFLLLVPFFFFIFAAFLASTVGFLVNISMSVVLSASTTGKSCDRFLLFLVVRYVKGVLDVTNDTESSITLSTVQSPKTDKISSSTPIKQKINQSPGH
jgi:hypothetical protein